MKLFRILTLGIMFSLIGGNALLASTGLKLSDFTDTSRLPTEDTWIIIDNSGTTDDFRGLKNVLGKAERDNREIKLVLPNIRAIPEEAFYTTDEQPITSLVSVSASNATDIGAWAFRYCPALTEISLPKVTNIGYSAFAYSSALAEVSLSNATYIGNYAFYGCDALTEVNFPKATYIGNYAFSYCPALTTMTIATESTLENIDADAFVRYSSSDSPTDTSKVTAYTSHANKDAGKFTGFGFKEVIGQ